MNEFNLFSVQFYYICFLLHLCYILLFLIFNIIAGWIANDMQSSK